MTSSRIRTWPVPSSSQASALGELLFAETGVCLGHERGEWMRDRLEAMLNRCQLHDWQSVLQRVDQDAGFRRKLIEALLTQETSWFRDRSLFTALAQYLAQASQQRQRSQRIGFFGCASGQEVYSVLIAADQYERTNPGTRVYLDAPILATDVSATAVASAESGLYSASQLQRGLSPEQIHRYFVPDEHSYRIHREFRDRVRFICRSVLAPGDIGRFDALFCRNVLVYFPVDLRASVLERLVSHLDLGGLLIMGASEKPVGPVAGTLERIQLGSVPVYRKI